MAKVVKWLGGFQTLIGIIAHNTGILEVLGIDFISKYKVLGLAVAFIMGVYVGQVIQSLVADILMPLIGLALPGLRNLSTLKIAIQPTALDAQGNPIDPNWTGQLFGIGNFIVAIIHS